jgi:hypothetical protein
MQQQSSVLATNISDRSCYQQIIVVPDPTATKQIPRGQDGEPFQIFQSKTNLSSLFLTTSCMTHERDVSAPPNWETH